MKKIMLILILAIGILLQGVSLWAGDFRVDDGTDVAKEIRYDDSMKKVKDGFPFEEPEVRVKAASTGRSTRRPISLNQTASNLLSLTLYAPSSGRIIANTSGYFGFNSNYRNVGQCSINDRTAIHWGALILASEPDGQINTMSRVPFAGTRCFEVEKGFITINLVCQGEGRTSVGDPTLTAIFVPTE